MRSVLPQDGGRLRGRRGLGRWSGAHGGMKEQLVLDLVHQALPSLSEWMDCQFEVQPEALGIAVADP